MKIIIKYSRDGAAKYISHLDMQRAFGRALRRANIDVQYSQGFNPHIVMSFASPLSVGYATNGDYLEVAMNTKSNPCEIKEALNAVLTADIRILNVRFCETNKKLMAQNHSASYQITFYFENEENCVKMNELVKKIMEAQSFLAIDRKGKEIDIRPLILELSSEKNVLYALLQNSSENALNPAVVANVCKGTGAVEEIRRIECFAAVQQKVLPFYELDD
ncbi:MAG: TIGR03936 family radical SAM-associated protein [Christensenellaceae bacterium]